MTNTVSIRENIAKKAYSIEIYEREVDKRGKTTGKSINRTSFQVKDFSGKTDLMFLKRKLMLYLMKDKLLER